MSSNTLILGAGMTGLAAGFDNPGAGDDRPALLARLRFADAEAEAMTRGS